jgi:ATP-dependent exoDNAse (exonuclease V) alpha subunit
LLDVIDRLLRVYRKNEFEPFGGVQVLLIGDAYQLAPIIRPDEWNILREFYSTPYFFGAKVIREYKPIYIELKKIYRQIDKQFISLLNKIRTNEVDYDDLEILNSKYTSSVPNHADHIILATHNAIVENTNKKKLDELTTTVKSYEASITGTFTENNFPGDKLLLLKEGAQVMFTKNDKSKRFYNGKIAKIKKLEEHKITIETEGKKDVIIERETWENIRYKWNEAKQKIEEEITGTFKQFPLRLAWAITIHKSQGLGFKYVIVDAGASFTAGQVYVALSRCTSFNGLVLRTKIPRQAIFTDLEVLEFSRNEDSINFSN